MNRNAFDWKDFVNTKLTLDNYNFDKIENLELYNDEYKRIAFLSHNFVNYYDRCNINNNNNKKTKCGNFSNILNKCETKYLGPEVKTYNCEKFLLLLRSPLIEPLFMAQTPELLFKKNYNPNLNFEFDFKYEFKKLGFYNALIKENGLEEEYENTDVNNINDLVKLFSILINKIEPQSEEELSNEDVDVVEDVIEDIKNNNKILEEAFNDYVNKFMKNELQGGGIGSFVKKTINRIAIVGLGCLYYTIKTWIYVSMIIAALVGGILLLIVLGLGNGKIGWGEATFIGDATTEISKQTQVKNYYTGRSTLGNIIHYGGTDLKKAFYNGDLGLIKKNINLRIIAFSIITYTYVTKIIDTSTNNDFIEITLNDITTPTNIGLKEKEKEKFILGIRKSFDKYLNNDVDYELLNTYLKKFFNYNERKITSYYIQFIEDRMKLDQWYTREVNDEKIITYYLKQRELPSSFQNIPNINNCEIISINGETNFELWRDTINKNKAERKYNLVTLYNPNPLPYKVVKGTRQLQVE